MTDNLDNEISVTDEQLPEALRHVLNSQPSETVSCKKYPTLIEALETKKRNGMLLETSEGEWQTTSGSVFTITPAFGKVWIAKGPKDTATFYAEEEPEFDTLVKELLSSGFLSDSVVHYLHIADRANNAVNFPDTCSQELVLDLIRDNALLKSVEGVWTWGVEGSPTYHPKTSANFSSNFAGE